MPIRTLAACLTSLILITACGSNETPEDSSVKGSVETQVENPSDAPLSEPMISEDVALQDDPFKAGKRIFLRCRSCHTLQEGEPHLTGPNLFGLFGASAGEKEGFGFTTALSSSDIAWDADTLDLWLENPGEYIPGNSMAFVGLRKQSDRAALIEYLAHATQTEAAE